MTGNEHQTQRAHRPRCHRDQGHSVQAAREPTLGPSPACFGGYLTGTMNAHCAFDDLQS